MLCCVVLPFLKSQLTAWCIDELQHDVTSTLSASAVAMMFVHISKLLSFLCSVNQYVFSAPSTQVRADEALQMSSQYTYS